MNVAFDLNINFASCQIYWVFKEAAIQAIEFKLYATKKKERKSKSEREKENASFACEENLEFEGGKTMRYEFEKLRVMPVTREMRE